MLKVILRNNRACDKWHASRFSAIVLMNIASSLTCMNLQCYAMLCHLFKLVTCGFCLSDPDAVPDEGFFYNTTSDLNGFLTAGSNAMYSGGGYVYDLSHVQTIAQQVT